MIKFISNKFVFLFLIFLCIKIPTSFSATKPECSFLPQPSRTMMGMKLETFKAYDDKRLGIGITYSSSSKRFSLFKYDLGFEIIDEDKFKKISEMSFQEFLQVAKMNKDKLIRNGLIKEKFSDLITFNIFFEIEGINKKFEFIGHGTDGKCIYKVRYTTNQKKPNLAAQQYAKLIVFIEKTL